MIVPLMLNPKSLVIRRQSQWHPPQNRSPNAGQPSSGSRGQSTGTVPVGHGPLQYRGSQPGSLTMVVWFDQSFEPDGDITDDIDTLQNWTCPTERVTSAAGNPPRVTFTWGGLHFVGHIQTLSVTYKLFGVTGQPVRAEVSITITENPPPVTGTNPTSGGISGRRVHVMSAGDTLASVAYAEYRNPALWRALAEANGIDDPLRVAPGTTILVPPAPGRGDAP